MENLLKLPTWAIFIYLILATILINLNIGDGAFINSLIKVLGFVMFGLYPLSLGMILPEYLPKKITVNVTFFLINWVVWIGSFAVLLILFEGREINFHGLAALPFFYVMLAIVYVFLFPLKVLKSVQKRGEVSFGESIGMGLLLMIWPVGLWMIHPEVKRILDSQIPTSDLPTQ